MKTTHKISILFYLLSIILLQSCGNIVDQLDEIKQFHPEDKYFKASMVSLHFITEVSPIGKVDTAFNEMIKIYQLPLSAKGAKDGKYVGESPLDAFDYAHVVEIEILDEKIVSVDYNEILKGGIGKEEDDDYCKEMSQSGTTPAIAYPAMEAQLLETQDILEVDAVSGATYSLYRFRWAMTVALMKANVE